MTQLQSARGGPVTPELARVARRGNLAAGRFARFGLTLLCVTPAIALGAPPAAIDFWNQQRRGANLFDAVETRTRLEAAAKMGIEFVRIAPDKWKAAGRDFLIGNADDYRGIPEADLAQLRAVLDEAHAAGLKVVLTCLSLPGARWKQHNGDDNDLRLWRDFRYHQQSAAFWRDLAKALRGHPALVGFNPLNEPRPEAMVRPPLASWQVAEWHKSVADTPADINRFYAVVCKAIRDVDPDTPIIVDASFDATVPGFAALRPVPVRHVLYAAHMYDPFELTCFRENQNRFSFPGPMAGGEGPSVRVDREWLAGWLAPLASWAGRNQVPPTRILVGEFGCDRRVRGADQYLSDLVSIFNQQGWHWAFYSFREDTWDGMDYECGDRPLGAAYWEAAEKGQPPARPWHDNPIFDVLRRELSRPGRRAAADAAHAENPPASKAKP